MSITTSSRLLAILAADAAGYSRLMSRDAGAAMTALNEARAVFRREIAAGGGRVVDTAGDSVLAVFSNAADSIGTARRIQAELAPDDAGDAAGASALRFRIGLHLGDVTEAPDGSVYGDGVNVAARLQQSARPGGIVVSQALHGAAVGRIDVRFEDLGPQRLKGIEQPLRAFRIETGVEVEVEGDAAARPLELAPESAPAPAPAARSAPALVDGAPPAPRTNLPAHMTPLIGRSDDLAALNALVDRHRLVTVCGAGGMGKTLLAQHLLHSRAGRYVHGICWIELATTRDAAALPAAAADQLGVKLGAGAPLVALANALAPLDLLIVLDNAEQLLDALAELAQRLLDTAPNVTLIVTSQVPLKLASERVYRIDALSVPGGAVPLEEARAFGAVALFAERARQADARFALTEQNVGGVIEICRALDGVALAVELAAARAQALGIARIAGSMQERLRLLTTSRNRSAPPRQQTLRAALEWSWDLLDERERIVMRRLAVMVGSFDAELAQQVVADAAIDEWAALDAIEVLVDRSLLAVLPDTGDEQPRRYRLLDSVRVHAREQLVHAGEADATERRHAEAMADRLEREGWPVELHALFMIRFAPDLDNARAAFAWVRTHGDDLMAVRMGPALMRALGATAYTEVLSVAEECLTRVRPDMPALACASVWMAASVPIGSMSAPRAARLAAQAAAAAREAGHAGWLARALSMLATAYGGSGDIEASVAALAEARSLLPSLDPLTAKLVALNLLDAQQTVVRLRGDGAQSLPLLHHRLEIESELGQRDNPVTLSSIVDAEVAVGEFDAAIAHSRPLLQRFATSRDAYRLAIARLNLCAALCGKGEFGEAIEIARLAWADAVRFGQTGWWADYLAFVAARQGRPRHASRLAGYSDATYLRHEDVRQENEAAAVEKARGLAREAIGETEAARLEAEGAALGDEAARAIAFASEDAG